MTKAIISLFIVIFILGNSPTVSLANGYYPDKQQPPLPVHASKSSKLTLESLLPKELKAGLMPAEKILLKKALKGEVADFRIGEEKTDDPKNADSWGEARTIRTKLLYWLLADGEAAKSIHRKGVRLTGAIIPTPLDYEDCILTLPFELRGQQ